MSQPSGPDLLDRHQLRRAQGIPTVTLLAGPVGLGVRRWRSWSRQLGRAVAAPEQPDVGSVVSAWVATLAAGRPLLHDAVAWVAARGGRPTAELQSQLGAMTRHDLEQFWAGLPLDPSHNHSAAVCRALLTHAVNGSQVLPGPHLATALAAEGGLSLPHLVAGLTGLVPTEAWPTIVQSLPTGQANAATWLTDAGRTLADLATQVPLLPVAIAASAQVAEAALTAEPPPRLTALLREGLVRVEGWSEPELASWLQGSGAKVPAATIHCLATAGVGEDVAAALVQAAKQPTHPPTAEQQDAARSAAEQFLFEMLESMPETAGLFECNRRLEFLHGHARAEADLVAPSFRLVIELDGGYYHLADEGAYRRDRRKDWEYQRHGYLVLRFLSEDVVARLEGILGTILAAVEHRRQSPPA